jgi:hypothetical protein
MGGEPSMGSNGYLVEMWILLDMFIYLVIAPCRCRGLDVRIPRTIIFHAFQQIKGLVEQVKLIGRRLQEFLDEGEYVDEFP